MLKLRYKHNPDIFGLIFPEDIPLIKHRKILGYYEEFRNAIAESFYPETQGINQLNKWSWLINLIGKEINNQIDWDNIVELDLYHFFIGKIEKTSDNQIIFKRSHIELLLGFKDIDPLAEANRTMPTEDILFSTGDALLDTATVTLLNFKHGHQLLQTYSLSQLMAINKYANQLHEKARKDAEANPKNDNLQKTPATSFHIGKIASIVPRTPEQQDILQKVANKGIPIPH